MKISVMVSGLFGRLGQAALDRLRERVLQDAAERRKRSKIGVRPRSILRADGVLESIETGLIPPKR
jgi:hypothetical protein